MKIARAKSALKTAILFTGAITIVGCFIATMVSLLVREHKLDEALCAPDRLDHAFMTNHQTHGVCLKEDGTLFLSGKTR